MSWKDDWRRWVGQQAQRHTAVGITYPIRAEDEISEVVARAMMSKREAPSEYTSEEEAA